MERDDQRRIVEAVILGSPEPVSAARLGHLVPGGNAALVRKLVEELNAGYAEHGHAFEIVSVGGGYQVRTLPEFAEYLQRLASTRPLRLSRAALETLAVVAYRQPVTRGEVEQVRGVEAGAVLKSLLDRRLVRLAGHREVPGRPLLYGTTRRFLEVFGIDSLEDLPSLRSIEELSAEPANAEAAARLLGTPVEAGAAGGATEAAGEGDAPSPEDAEALEAGEGDAPEAEDGEASDGDALEASDDDAGVPVELAEVFDEAEPTGKPH